MTRQSPGWTGLQLLQARNALRQIVEALLHGSGLDIRELTSALAVSNPVDPDRGSIHISYTSGEASLKRTTWTYLGPLQGYAPDDDPDREPPVDAGTIIATLTGDSPEAPR